MMKGLMEAQRTLASVIKSIELQAELEAAAAQLETSIKQSLSHPPGSADHSVPWLRTGVLRASISHETDGKNAVVGSSDPVAVDQELGTRSIPPRPFLAPIAAREAPKIIEDISDRIRDRG